jgi:DNA-binding transcriptional LysR family regulator
MLTLRQIEVLRAIMVTGTVGGAARLLNTSSPGISRVMKHAEDSLGLRLFSRKNGRYAPTPEAKDIFSQINNVYDKVEDLRFVVDRMRKGTEFELRVGAVPSISAVMVPRAVADVRKQFPQLTVEVDVLKIEDAIDYLLLGRGEAAAVSARNDHPMLTFEPLAAGKLVCVVPETHPLAGRRAVSVREIVRYPLIGVDPNDPFGTIMTRLFARNRLDYSVAIRARFGSTVCALVTAGLGIAIIDRFTLAGGNWPQLRAIEIEEPTDFETFVAFRRDEPVSSYCDAFVAALRTHMLPPAGRRKK